MGFVQSVVACLGRWLISGIFLLFLAIEYTTWPSTWILFTSTLSRWGSMYKQYPLVSSLFSFLSEWAAGVISIVIFFQLAGALMLFFGWRVRLAASFLLLFLVPTTILVYDFWNVRAGMNSPEFEVFLRNMAIVGGLLLVLAYGKGKKEPKSEHSPSKKGS